MNQTNLERLIAWLTKNQVPYELKPITLEIQRTGIIHKLSLEHPLLADNCRMHGNSTYTGFNVTLK